MKVTLIAYTPRPDFVCAHAAGISTNTSVTEENYAQLLRRVISYGHLSVVEHASFTFLVEGISRACSHQLVRHRIASFTQESQRYVRYETLSYVLPSSLEKTPILKERVKKTLDQCTDTYRALLEAGIHPEDARAVLPNATPTRLIVTMNGRELLHFFGLRCCTRAQTEIRLLALEMLRLVKEVAPVIFEKADAQCVHLGYCPEPQSCGRYPLKKDALSSR